MATALMILGAIATIGATAAATFESKSNLQRVKNLASKYRSELRTKMEKGQTDTKLLDKINTFIASVQSDIASGKYGNSAVSAKINEALEKLATEKQEEADSKVDAVNKTNLDIEDLSQQYNTDREDLALEHERKQNLYNAVSGLGTTAMYLGQGFESGLSGKGVKK